MGRMSKNKGARFERIVAHLFKDEGYDASRTAQYRGNTGDAGDVEGPPGLHIEAKHQEQFRIYDWMAQSIHDATEEGKGNLPIVIFKKNHHDVLVTMRFEDWIQLYREWECRNG